MKVMMMMMVMVWLMYFQASTVVKDRSTSWKHSSKIYSLG